MRKLAFFALAGIFLIAKPLSAQLPPPSSYPVQEMDRAPVDGDQLVYTGYEGGGGTLSGAVVGPYYGMLSSSPTTATFTMYCVDFRNYVYTGSTGWTINATSLGATSDSEMGQTRLGTTAGSLADYQKAAFLANYFSADKSNWTAIHGALWTITGGADFSGSAGVQGAMDFADKAYDDFVASAGSAEAQLWAQTDFSRWYVMTPTGSPNSQEFIGRVVTPEPATVLLLASGLLILGVVARRRFKVEDAA